jgi:hypothetical protein
MDGQTQVTNGERRQQEAQERRARILRATGDFFGGRVRARTQRGKSKNVNQDRQLFEERK